MRDLLIAFDLVKTNTVSVSNTAKYNWIGININDDTMCDILRINKHIETKRSFVRFSKQINQYHIFQISSTL